jgi:hypothetical protein
MYIHPAFPSFGHFAERWGLTIVDSLDDAKAAFRGSEGTARGAFGHAPGEAQRTLTIG